VTSAEHQNKESYFFVESDLTTKQQKHTNLHLIKNIFNTKNLIKIIVVMENHDHLSPFAKLGIFVDKCL